MEKKIHLKSKLIIPHRCDAVRNSFFIPGKLYSFENGYVTYRMLLALTISYTTPLNDSSHSKMYLKNYRNKQRIIFKEVWNCYLPISLFKVKKRCTDSENQTKRRLYEVSQVQFIVSALK